MDNIKEKAINNMIYVTTDYDSFTIVPSNRNILDSFLKKLMKSIQLNNLLKNNPIIVTSKLELYDGQHRLECAKRLKLPIYYTITDNPFDSRIIASVNDNQHSWKLVDYLNCYARQGNENYLILEDFAKQYDYGIPQILRIFNIHEKSLFRLGKIKNISSKFSEAKAIADHILEFKEHIDFYKSRFFIFAICRIYRLDNYNPETMMKRMSNNAGAKLKKCPDTETYIRLIEVIYNYHSKFNERFI